MDERESDIKLYPGWKQALDQMLSAHNKNGFGTVFSHDQIKEWMDIPQPKTIDEYRKTELEYLTGLDRIKKELLFEHSLWLENRRAHGYEIVHPDEQVTAMPDKHIRKARRELNKASAALSIVQEELLSAEAKEARMKHMARTGFLKAAFNSRKTYKIGGGR